MHVTVMPVETIEYLAIDPEGVYVDATCGLGGHTRRIAERLTSGLVFSSDRDGESIELARSATVDLEPRIEFSQGPFSTLADRYRSGDRPLAAGLLADLGVSRYQLTEAERGFSLQANGALDMRMDRTTGETAADLVNQMPEKALADVIYTLGEERRSRQIARAIVRARPITTTLHLARVVEQVAPRTGRTHPATRTFMALRLMVNGELEELAALLDSAPRLLRPQGRMVVLTFMSLEDRIVKRRFQEWARAGRCRLLNRHVVTPGDAEVSANPSSRSAKLRAIEWAA
jgi:16S rRNA (cytosine1402-N4)-methyltransferase